MTKDSSSTGRFDTLKWNDEGDKEIEGYVLALRKILNRFLDDYFAEEFLPDDE